MRTAPFVSVVIPSHNRAHQLPTTLGALAKQEYPLQQMEVIIAADGCTDHTISLLREYNAPWPLKVVELPGSGPSAARNRGAAAARGELLIFMDDDIEVVPEFVTAHAAAYEPRERHVAIGHLPPLQGKATKHNYFADGLQSWWRGRFFHMRQAEYRFGYADLFSGNFSLPAALFSEVGAFNEALRCHEDYELGLRLLAAGATFRFAPDATGLHHDVTDVDRGLQRRLAEGRADVTLARRYPTLRAGLPLASGSFSLLSRALRFLAFRAPSIGDGSARLLRRVLDPMERAQLNKGWRFIFYHLQDYWYWRGIAEEVEAPQVVRALLAGARQPMVPEPEHFLDIGGGIQQAEQELATSPVSAVRVRIGSQLVGDLVSPPGSGTLRSSELRHLLIKDLAGETVVAAALAGVLPGAQRTALEPAIERQVRLATVPLTDDVYLWGAKKVVEIELTDGVPDVDLRGYQGLHALVRSHGKPLGRITIPTPPTGLAPAELLHQHISRELGWEVIPQHWGVPERRSSQQPPVSVIVCTRDRAVPLRGCLTALLAQDYPDYEIVVVDNASQNDDTAKVAAEFPVRYVREQRPGLDWARNRGIYEASHDIVAFTDDDARPDPGWLKAIARAFAEPEVMVVTGPVLPAELETSYQNLFEFGYGGMSHGLKRRIVRRAELTPQELLWASGFGAGANMAFRRAVFADIGDFDVALDVGTPTGGGGDVEMLHRVVANWHTLVYEPQALVWHLHRREAAAFGRLVFNNGRGFGAYLLTCTRRRTVGRLALVRFALFGWLWPWLLKRLLKPEGLPRRFVWGELHGAVTSVGGYFSARRRAREIAQAYEYQDNPPPESIMDKRGEPILSGQRNEPDVVAALQQLTTLQEKRQ